MKITKSPVLGDPALLDGVRKFFEEQIPFCRLLGMKLESLDHGFARLRLPYSPDFIGDPFRPALHGGVIATFIDTAGGAAAFTMIGLEDRVSTIDMRVDYLLPAEPLDLLCEARVVRAGNSVIVAQVDVRQPDRPQLVADGRGVYGVKRARHRHGA